MPDIILKPKSKVGPLKQGNWFINSEIYTKEKVFNQLLGEYLAKLLFNLPSSFSSLVRVSDAQAEEIDGPFFYDQHDRKHLLITDRIESEGSVDLNDIFTSTVKCESPTENIISDKMRLLRELCRTSEEYSYLREEFIRKSLLDFFMGQYGRGFKGDILISTDKGVHISAIYSFGNSFDFEETESQKKLCDSVFGTVSVEVLFDFINTSKNRSEYLAKFSNFDFAYVLDYFYGRVPLELSDNTKKAYVDFAREKQDILIRNLYKR